MTVTKSRKMTFEEYLIYDDGTDKREEKREEYAQFGIPEYWIIDFLLGTFSVLTLANGIYIEKVYTEGDRILSNTFPKTSLTMSQVLENI